MLAIILWAIFGTITTNTQGMGILVKEGGLHNIVSTGNGLVTEIYVKVGEEVAKGSAIAKIKQYELDDQLLSLQNQLLRLSEQNETLSRLENLQLESTRSQSLAEEEGLQSVLNIAKQQLGTLQSELETQELLRKKGLVSTPEVIDTHQTIFSMQQQIQQAQNTLKELPLRIAELERTVKQGQLERQEEMRLLQSQVKSAEDKLAETSMVRSSRDGRILSLRIEGYSTVTIGQSVALIGPGGDPTTSLQAILYVPAHHAKQIGPGSAVKISPLHVRPEEYGYLVGTVVSVSELPVEPEEMEAHLPQTRVVKVFTDRTSIPVELSVELPTDPQTFSGYQWTSAGGAPHKITEGTVCTALVAVRQQAPITLVIPVLKRWLGLVD